MSYTFPDWFIQELVDIDIKQEALNHTLTGKQLVYFKCPKGHIYQMQVCRRIKVRTMTEGNTCPICNRIKGAAIRRKGYIKDYVFPQWFKDDLVNEQDIVRANNSDISANDTLEFKCKSGHIYTQRVADHISVTTMQPRYGCPECGKIKSINTRKKNVFNKRSFPQWFIDDVYLDTDKQRAISGYLSTDESILFCCDNGHIYKQRVGDHITISTGERRYGCRDCAIINSSERVKEQKFNERPEYPDWFIKSLVNDKDREKALNKTLTTNDYVLFKCPNGHEYTRKVNKLIKIKDSLPSSTCPVCYQEEHRSKSEKEIESFVLSLGMNVTRGRSILPSKRELDIFIPDKNIGIEYNSSYFHSSLSLNTPVKQKDTDYHINKYTECKQIGIQLISIFEPDWNEKQDKIKQYLKDTLQPTQQKIYARKCDIKHITSPEANMMYDKYHLLGKTPIQTISYGLYYNDEIVSCMSFQNGRYKEGKEPVWCLTRFVTKSGMTIIGGASKLLSFFEKEYQPTMLVSYSDNDYFQGGVYSKLGFDCLGITKSPRYYWYLHNKELKREHCQLKVLSNKYPELYQESLSITGNKEDYIMLRIGAIKVYRSGHTKWMKIY